VHCILHAGLDKTWTGRACEAFYDRHSPSWHTSRYWSHGVPDVSQAWVCRPGRNWGWVAGGTSQRAMPLTDSRCSSVVSSFAGAHSDDGALRSARSRASRRSNRACGGGRDPRRESDSPPAECHTKLRHQEDGKQGALYLLGIGYKAPDMMVWSPAGDCRGVRHEGPKRARVERGSASAGSVRVWS